MHAYGAFGGPVNIHHLIEPCIHEITSNNADRPDTAAIGKRLLRIIDEQQQQTTSQMSFGVFLSNIQNNAKELLMFESKDLKYKIAGLLLIDCLLELNYNDEIYTERRTDLSRVLFNMIKSIRCSIDSGEAFLRSVAQCVGHLARVATPPEFESVTQTFFSLAMELVKDQRVECSRLMGVLLLKELGANAAHFCFQKRHLILTELWNLICDKNSQVRLASAETLEGVLVLTGQRDALFEHLRQALKVVETGFSSSRIEKVVGSLLILDCIAGGTAVTPQELNEAAKAYNTKDSGMHLDDLIWTCLMWKDYTEMDLKQLVIKIMPKLGVAFNSAFHHNNEHTPPLSYLQYTIKFLLDTIRQKKDRAIAYQSLGKLFVSMASYLRSNVEEIYVSILDGFKDPFCTAALECVGMVVSNSPTFRNQVTSPFIDSMFQGGLTKDLIAVLEIIFHHVHSVRRHIQTRLCNDVIYVLQSNAVVLDEDNSASRGVSNGGSREFTMNKGSARASHWGSPSKGIIRAIKGSKPQSFFSMSPFTQKSQTKPVSSDEMLILALDVLASPLFFPRHLDQSVILLRINFEYVLRYLDDYNPKIRSAAAATCISIVDKAVSSPDVDADLIPKIIDNLLMIGVGDDSADIRYKIFASLTPSLDLCISKSDCIHCLIDALNDESPKVRTASISVLARASHYDSVHILPIVLLSLRSLLNLLQTSRDSTTLHGAVRMLQSLVKGLGSFIVPYVRQVLKPLLDLLSNSSHEIVGEVLSTIGEVAIACPDLIHEHLDTLFPSLILALRDSSSTSRQETAVVALGKLVTSLYMVNEPYTKYPGLFEGLVSAIQNTQDGAHELRQQAIKTTGLLGALDIGLFEKYMRAKTGGSGNVFAQDTVEIDLNDDTELSRKSAPHVLDEESLSKLEKYYLSVVVKSLMTILKDPSLSIHHQLAINVCTNIVKNLGRRSHYQVDEIIDGIFSKLAVGGPSGSSVNAMIDFLIVVITSVGHHVSKHYSKIIAFICNNFATHYVLCLNIIEALYSSISAHEFSFIVRDVVPILLATIKAEPANNSKDESFNSALGVRNSAKFSSDDNENRKSLPKTEIIIKTIRKVSNGFSEYKMLIAAALLEVISLETVVSKIRLESLTTLMHLVSDMELHQLVGLIIHPLVRLLESNEVMLLEAALSSLCVLACSLGRSFEPFIVPVRRRTRALSAKENIPKLRQLEEYESLVDLIIKNRPLPRIPESALYFVDDESTRKYSTAATTKSANNESLRIDSFMLESAWTLAGRTGASDFVEWYKRLTFEFIRQSPSFIIRRCNALAKNYRPLAQELLNASFVSLWDTIFSSTAVASDVVLNVPLILALESALKNSNIPRNITNAILNLAEFMDLQDKMLPFDIRLLASNAASSSGMLATCVRYRDMEFRSVNVAPTPECIESLISVYHQLGLQDAADGLKVFVEQHYPDIQMQASWLEKLNRYDDAKAKYLEENKKWESYFSGDAPVDELWLGRELGILRCLNHLGEFEELEKNARRLKGFVKNAEQTEDKASLLSQIKTERKNEWIAQIQHLGANAAWMLGHWEEMEEFVDTEYFTVDNHVLENNTNFYRTIIAIQRRDYSKALNMIKDIRSTLSEHIGLSLNQNFSRAKRGMVSMQVLAEIEEVVEFNQVAAKPDIDVNNVDLKFDVTTPAYTTDVSSKKAILLKKWDGRFKLVPKEVKVYRQILAVHTLVAEPLEDLDSWLELVSLCRKERKFNLCENILKRLGAPLQLRPPSSPQSGSLVVGEDAISDPRMMRVFFSCCKYQWDVGQREMALEGLLGMIKANEQVDFLDSKMKLFKAYCLLKSAEWKREHVGYSLKEVLDTVREARDLASDSYHVWHAWALFNYMQLQRTDSVEESPPNLNRQASDGEAAESLPIHRVQSSLLRKVNSFSGASLANLVSNAADLKGTYVIEAIRGFTRSLSLSQDQPIVHVLQDTLRLLTLWFSYGNKPQVFEVLNAEIDKVSADNWLQVLPQLIARMHVTTITGLLKRLLIKIASNHPQAIVWSILVAYNTADTHQKSVAAAVISDMRQKRAQLVDEATMVSKELLRVAITPHELWNDGLEKAAKYYVTDKSLDNMVALLFDLHDSLNYTETSTTAEKPDAEEGFIEGMSKIGYTTLRDISFRYSYSRDLTEAYEWLIKFRRTGRTTDLHQAWDLYHKVFKRLSAQLKTFKNVNLNHVSPALCSALNLQLAVPGSYVSNEIITISSFSTSVDVIASKQRPRKITMVGSNGVNYHFLLKGNEDLRQDERVMQLFGLINACLENDRSTRSKGLGIIRYSVLPLSNNSGVIGWVENCDTLNQLVRQYRYSKDLKVNIEARLKLSKAPDYDKLTLIQKIDIFTQVQDETTGLDLAKMLWLKSRSSDIWVERRANYTTSLAVMSMVGYILGLGDRHPSNLMLDRVSGRIVHIDFGDCFEVSMQRQVFPETVPFRLTRMMVAAMEASGIEGTYRLTCNRVMKVLRANKDSLMAMLEAFVYDPLISWRLLARPKFEFDRIDRTETDANDITETVNHPVEMIRTEMAGSVDGAQLLGGTATDHKEPMGFAKSLANVVLSNGNDANRRRQSKGAISDSERKSIEHISTGEDNLNARAMEVIGRIEAKLTGSDFTDESIDIETQVDLLIKQATSIENLCQLFPGWCSLW